MGFLGNSAKKNQVDKDALIAETSTSAVGFPILPLMALCFALEAGFAVGDLHGFIQRLMFLILDNLRVHHSKAKLKIAATAHMTKLEHLPERVKHFFQTPRVKYAA